METCHLNEIHHYLPYEIAGILPWKFLPRSDGTDEANQSRERQIVRLKKSCKDDPRLFFPGEKVCPVQIKDINHYLGNLKFGDIPDYSFLELLLDSMRPNANQDHAKEILCENLNQTNGKLSNTN